MPPKPRPRNASTAPKGSSALAAAQPPQTKDVAMPPPPNPPTPRAILEPEMNALQGCLRSAIVKTGQIYQFYTDVARLGVQGHAPPPPRSLVASLGREVEKYDQLCDAMESHLVRAIAVLERDINRERNRLREEELAAKGPEALADTETQERAAPTAPSSPSSQQQIAVHGSDDFTQTQPTPATSPPSGALAPAHSGRRPSAISLSSLHRPAFPHKLDLSSTALKLDEADILARSALASPVTLAPKSARPTASTEFPPDFLSSLAGASEGHVDIDLTTSELHSGSNADNTAGNSADKPIELDLDMDADIFGPASGPSNTATSTVVQDLMNQNGVSAPSGLDNAAHKDQDRIDMEIFGALDQANEGHEIFGSFHGPEQGTSDHPPQADQPNPTSSTAAPSPGSLLASFNTASSGAGEHSSDNVSGLDASFDMGSLDLGGISNDFNSGFDFGPHTENGTFSDMEALFNLGDENESKDAS
ncbi:hypothetical protein NEOLEDRAFT_1138453 [Neolentinus lepideus HHB14362 ss-1]|uniref:Uncharacterized protein n=1 Tax=Neolentinus lepideus HHB14362 ss-1 TaxID=1314782 RepID=A0A165Q9P7_9AGAM|nr:hypothetical protein NEOLEDRAFT_1138453 [Neolentinus lepideus HHB14362 ss-1]